MFPDMRHSDSIHATNSGSMGLAYAMPVMAPKQARSEFSNRLQEIKMGC